ncbi:MAG: class I SAM-dependent methyltransferase [Planctomycetes bacterium]|nr:class I SAM-dependent methyltransferase [Planctomycetota bacterium]
MAAHAFAERLRARALIRLIPTLGPQWVLVTDSGTPALPPDEPGPRAVVATSTSTAPRGSVRGAADRLPIQSESATGVLVFALHGIELLATSATEARRLLQPGGVVVFLSAWRADQVEALDSVLQRAGLTPWRRVAIRRTGVAPSALTRALPWIEERRAAAATGAERVECAIVARRAGGVEADLPTSASVLSSMFVPRFARRPR